MTRTDPTFNDSAEGHYTVTDEDLLRATERKRLRSLVQADVATADTLHADDFQLINPAGRPLTKEQYLSGIASGDIDYHLWEPESIDVRLHGSAAILRYQARLEISVNGQRAPLRRYWHIDFYELRNERWQVVWSQATEIR